MFGTLKNHPSVCLGYANEIGEAFRPVIPVQYVNLSYAVAVAYVLADCADKTYKKYNVNTRHTRLHLVISKRKCLEMFISLLCMYKKKHSNRGSRAVALGRPASRPAMCSSGRCWHRWRYRDSASIAWLGRSAIYWSARKPAACRPNGVPLWRDWLASRWLLGRSIGALIGWWTRRIGRFFEAFLGVCQ